MSYRAVKVDSALTDETHQSSELKQMLASKTIENDARVRLANIAAIISGKDELLSRRDRIISEKIVRAKDEQLSLKQQVKASK